MLDVNERVENEKNGHSNTVLLMTSYIYRSCCRSEELHVSDEQMISGMSNTNMTVSVPRTRRSIIHVDF